MAARFPALALAALAAMPTGAAGEPLGFAEIEAVIPGATTSGVNAFGNPYTVRFMKEGLIEGVAGGSDEYRDGGDWWIEGDSLCRRWNVWLDGQTNCFSVTIENGTIIWLDTSSGKTTVESFSPAR